MFDSRGEPDGHAREQHGIAGDADQEQGAAPAPAHLGTATAREREIVELLGEIDRLTARLWQAVAAWDAAGDWQATGAATPVAALAALAPLARTRAARLVATARFVGTHADTATALDERGIACDHVEALARAARERDEHYARDEEVLLDAARTLRVDDLSRVARRWRHLADDDLAAGDADRAHEARRLHASTTFEGALRLDGWLAGDDAAVVRGALDRYTRPDPAGTPPDDRRSAAQRRADALVEVCRVALDHPEAPGKPAAAIYVIVDVVSLARHRATHLTDTTCDLPTGPAGRSTVERLACDALVSYLLTDGSVILDAGRRRRTVSPAQRRALAARDRHCVWPGCDRPPDWCDAHHLDHWVAHHGSTRVRNLALVCRHHHRWLHDRRLTLRPAGDRTWAVESRRDPGLHGPDPP